MALQTSPLFLRALFKVIPEPASSSFTTAQFSVFWQQTDLPHQEHR